jgi:hypothetical protein
VVAVSSHGCRILYQVGWGLGSIGERTGLRPVGVHEQHRLRGALLPAARVRVLVALPRHVRLVGHIRPQDLPVEARILQKHLRRHSSGLGSASDTAAGRRLFPILPGIVPD